MKHLNTFLFTILATFVFGQDYIMYETHTLTPKEGHEQALNEEIAEHNRLFHADGPYENYMFSILNGPRSGDILFAMGSCTFTQMDNRPSSPEHNKDWNGVLAHTVGGAKHIEYWELNKALSYDPADSGNNPKMLCKARFFEVADNSDFIDMQAQFKKTLEAMGSKTPRNFYRNQFQNREGRDWVVITWHDSWADLDKGNWDLFKSTYIKLYGEDGWNKMDEAYDSIVLSREDEMRMRRTDLQAGDK